MGVRYDRESLDAGIRCLQAAGITDLTEYPQHQRNHNCWGLTSYLLNWEKLQWLSQDPMIANLNEFSSRVIKQNVHVGDILVFGEDGLVSERNQLVPHRYLLWHTALLTEIQGDYSSWCYLHKPGMCSPEIGTVDGVESQHWYCNTQESIQQIRRAHGRNYNGKSM